MQPVFCLVTDRQRFGGDLRRLVQAVADAADAGVHLIQVRERDLPPDALVSLVRQCVEAVRHTRSRVLVNDRADVALLAGAHGVHLRADSGPASDLRAAAPPGFLIGRSVHSLDEVGRSGAPGSGLDYLVFGTVFATRSKPGRPACGVDDLRQAADATPLPVLAIGGITADTIAGLGRTGAAGVAAIGLFADTPGDLLHAMLVQAALAFHAGEVVKVQPVR